MEKISGKILSLAYYANKKELKKLCNDLRLRKYFLDDWFEKFLARYGERLNYEKLDTPHWKDYNANMKEYHEIEQYLKQVNYYVSKFS